MAAFYSNLASNEVDAKKRSALEMKAIQFEDSVSQELRFVDFVKGLTLSDPVFYKDLREEE